jgi:hypothetical protein
MEYFAKKYEKQLEELEKMHKDTEEKSKDWVIYFPILIKSYFKWHQFSNYSMAKNKTLQLVSI